MLVTDGGSVMCDWEQMVLGTDGGSVLCDWEQMVGV